MDYAEEVKSIYEQNGATPKDAQSIANALGVLIGDTHTDNKRFIYELLQNADDQPQNNKSVSVLLKTLPNHLLFLHNGNPFSYNDVNGISSIGNSTKKEDIEKTGYKGIGFKSVFAESETVYIYSGNYSFAFDKTQYDKEKVESIPWQIKPIWTEKNQFPKEIRCDSDFFNSNVGIALTVSNETIKIYNSLISEILSDARFLLFLRHVESVYFRDLVVKKATKDSTIFISNGTDTTEWILSDYEYQIPEDVRSKLRDGNSSKIPQKLLLATKTKISFAVNYSSKGITKVEHSVLYNYLPTKDTFGFPFLVNADFILNSSREYIHDDNNWNIFLFDLLGRLIVEWAISLSDKSNYLAVLPLKKAKEDSTIYNAFWNSYCTALKTEAFILNHKGQLSRQDDIIIDQTKLSDIIGADLFCRIIGTDKSLPSSTIDISILREKIFDKIENKEFKDIICKITNNDDFNKWFISSTYEQKRALYKWIIRNDTTQQIDDLKEFVKYLPLFRFGDEFKSSQIEDDYIIKTEHIKPIKDILEKLGFKCSTFLFNERDDLFKYVDLKDEKSIFETICKSDFSLLSSWERKCLFFNKFEGVGEASLKSIKIFRNLNGDFKPLSEMAAYKPTYPPWLSDYIICKVDYSNDLTPYLIQDENVFNDIVRTHYQDFDNVPLSEIYNSFKNNDKGQFTRELIDKKVKSEDLLSIVEKSDTETKEYFLQKIERINLTSGSRYDRNSYEYRVLQIALHILQEKPSDFSSKIYFNGRCIQEFNVKDSFFCEYTQNGEKKKVKFILSELLPEYKNVSDSINEIIDLFEIKKDLDKFFVAETKGVWDIYNELEKKLISATTNSWREWSNYNKRYYTKSVIKYSWKMTPTALQYLFFVVFGRPYQLLNIELECKSIEFISDFMSFLYNNKIDITNASFTSCFRNSFVGKFIDTQYVIDEERLIDTINQWADSAEKKQYLLKYCGVCDQTDKSIQFRQLFLKGEDIDFIDDLSYSTINAGLKYLSQAEEVERPFRGENQKTILLQLRKRKNIRLTREIDIDKFNQNSLEWNTNEYNEWIKDNYPHIFLYDGKTPKLLYFDNTLMLKYENGNYYYDKQNKKLFVNNTQNLNELLFVIANERKADLSMDDYRTLCMGEIVNNDKMLKKLQEENERLKKENDIYKNAENTSVDISKGENSTISKPETYAAQLEAQRKLKEWFPLWNFEEGFAKTDNSGKPICYSTSYAEDENGNEIYFVIKSYRFQNGKFYINPNEWEYLIAEEAVLFVYTGTDIKRIPISDLIKDQDKITISFKTSNLEIEDRISTFAESLKWFSDLHFEFDSFNIAQTAESVRDIYHTNEGEQYDNTEDDL